jgi:hypothetical protein
MSLIFLVSSGTRKCFVCDSGTWEKKVEKHWPREIEKSHETLPSQPVSGLRFENNSSQI